MHRLPETIEVPVRLIIWLLAFKLAATLAFVIMIIVVGILSTP